MTPTTDDSQDIQQQVLVEVRAIKQEVEQFNQKFDNSKKQHSELCN